jgi:hypothetical protein
MKKINEKKENIELIRKLQQFLLTDEKIDEDSLKKIGVDTTKKSQEFRNIKITNDFWTGLTVDVIDDLKDLDGRPINENKTLITRVKNLYQNDKKQISILELAELNIWNSSKDIVLGNLRLKNQSDFLFSYDYYDIEIVDKKKNIDGLWLDDVITHDRILDALKVYSLTAERLSNMKELDLNKDLEILLKSYFETVKKGGRSNQGDIDIILGSNHNYGIEIKLAREISKAGASQKAIGQIELYTRQFKGNFMLIVAGKTTEKNEKSVADVVRKAKDCGCAYYYIDAD